MHTSPTRSNGRRGEPAWDVARLFPNQGAWDEEDYLLLPGNHLVEFADGRVEVLPMPTTLHQLIVMNLYRALFAFTDSDKRGTVLVAPLRVRLRPGKYREPDVIFMLAKHASRMGERWWDGADLVMEVVSDEPEDRQRDLVTKRKEYARAGIPEYWIVDPHERRITVLKRSGSRAPRHICHGPARRRNRWCCAVLKSMCRRHLRASAPAAACVRTREQAWRA